MDVKFITQEILDEIDKQANLLVDRIKELEAENQYLTFFRQNADFGPAHSDVVELIHEAYTARTGLPVPSDWSYEDDEDEDDTDDDCYPESDDDYLQAMVNQ